MTTDVGSSVPGGMVGGLFSQAEEYVSQAALSWEGLCRTGRRVSFIFHWDADVERISQEPLLLSWLSLPELRCKGCCSSSHTGERKPKPCEVVTKSTHNLVANFPSLVLSPFILPSSTSVFILLQCRVP